MPITDEDGNHVGALEIQRNVTDEAVVQVKYQEMLETEARERERLANQIRARTKELLETNQLLLKTQKELLAYKKGLSRVARPARRSSRNASTPIAASSTRRARRSRATRLAGWTAGRATRRPARRRCPGWCRDGRRAGAAGAR